MSRLDKVEVTTIRYKDMSLAELLELRDKIHSHKNQTDKKFYVKAMGYLQSLIYKKRTTTKGGLFIPYNKDRTEEY